MKTQLENYPQIYEKIIYFEDNQAISLYPGENHPELAFNQVEADKMFVNSICEHSTVWIFTSSCD